MASAVPRCVRPSRSCSTSVADTETRYKTLLLHGNALDAAHLGWYLDWLTARGYRVIPLSEALADPAYHEPDPPPLPRYSPLTRRAR